MTTPNRPSPRACRPAWPTAADDLNPAGRPKTTVTVEDPRWRAAAGSGVIFRKQGDAIRVVNLAAVLQP